MVQYKKDEIKEKIDSAALTVFAERGYSGTKISDIGKKAGVSVGNIYRYYKGKDEIFYAVVPESFLESLRNLLVDKVSAIKEKKLESIEPEDEFWLFNDGFINYMMENRERILILFKHNQDTKYKNAKAEIVDFMMKTVKDIYPEQYNQFIDKNKGDFVIKIIYESLMNITLSILEEAKTHEEVKSHLKSMNVYHMFGITALLK